MLEAERPGRNNPMLVSAISSESKVIYAVVDEIR